MVICHEWMDGHVPKGSVVFIGDSITQSLCVDAVATPAVNFGIQGDTTLGVLSRIAKYRCLGHASAVVLAVGANDFNQEGDDNLLIENYRAMFNAIPPNVSIVVSAILPLEEGLLPPKNHGVIYRRIATLNDRLKRLCQTDARCVFVDAGAELKSDLGGLKSIYHVGDGIHLNADGYTVWIEALRSGLSEACQRG